MGGSGEVEETSQQRALADIGKAQMDDFKQRWLPLQKGLARNIVKANEPGSFERRHATAMSALDNTVAYGQAQDKLTAASAIGGGLGGSAHKLGMAGMARDQATSTGLASVAADQAADSQYVAGLGAVTALGRGEKATAVGGMGRVAAMSGRQAQADAAQSLADRQGYIQLATTTAGAGLGAWARGGSGSNVSQADLDEANDPANDDPIFALNQSKGWTRSGR